MYKILFFIFIHFGIYGVETPDPQAMDKCKNVIFFLSTPKSGSNLISGSLSAITRKPISWLKWGKEILDKNSPNTRQESYNRLGLPLVTNIPLLYRTHYDLDKLKKAPSNLNKLIFVTRNPKELLFRKFFISFPSRRDPDPDFIDAFLDKATSFL